jgi:hypothetical protein
MQEDSGLVSQGHDMRDSNNETASFQAGHEAVESHLLEQANTHDTSHHRPSNA